MANIKFNKEAAEGLNYILISWLETANAFANNIARKHAYEDIFKWLVEHNGEKLFKYNYGNGMTGYITNPKGMMIKEKWYRRDQGDLLRPIVGGDISTFISAGIHGFGQSPEVAFTHGNKFKTFEGFDKRCNFYKYAFFDIAILKNSVRIKNQYSPELFEVRSGELRKIFE